ncbi:Fibronectin type 3 and ankyrin repeat domains protein 1 [Amphibalanus amphitrite]|uniref:Fibronectin type 3 and ankyrin repeat domains protein 1 n=1 Tax=Amphibalanus amphitrite TaxID=1232801 RepID=A0A6A4VVD3_AMPAM|nr:Fibronectin type 3 and ankyrin repeat domains protein 1 [Amphibalanus amphitrite]
MCVYFSPDNHPSTSPPPTSALPQTFTFSTLPAPVSVSDLHRAVLLDRVERVETILTRRPRAVSAVSAYGLSALMVAAREGFRSMSSLLLRRGADVNQSSQGAGKTALMFASFACRAAQCVAPQRPGAASVATQQLSATGVQFSATGG